MNVATVKHIHIPPFICFFIETLTKFSVFSTTKATFYTRTINHTLFSASFRIAHPRHALIRGDLYYALRTFVVVQ